MPITACSKNLWWKSFLSCRARIGAVIMAYYHCWRRSGGKGRCVSLSFINSSEWSLVNYFFFSFFLTNTAEKWRTMFVQRFFFFFLSSTCSIWMPFQWRQVRLAECSTWMRSLLDLVDLAEFMELMGHESQDPTTHWKESAGKVMLLSFSFSARKLASL